MFQICWLLLQEAPDQTWAHMSQSAYKGVCILEGSYRSFLEGRRAFLLRVLTMAPIELKKPPCRLGL